MKKRVLSLLLVLVMLLGLLPTAALAAPGEEPPQAEGLTSDEIAQVPAVEEDVPATLSAVGSPTISLLTGNAHAHHGDNWNDGFKPYEGESKFASYDGSSSIQSSGLIISTKERDKFKNADYLWLPFTLSATVPAHSSITYNFSITLWHKRNSKGGVHYWVELLDGINDRAALNTGNNGNLSHGSLGRVCHSNKDGGSYTFNWTVTFDNYDSKAVKTVSHSMAYYVGACKSTSALTSYHHQVESSVTFNVKNTTLRKRITYDNNGGSGSTLAQVFSGSFIQLTPSPARTGYNFRGWKDDIDGGVYAGNGSYTKERGAHMTAQWTAKNLNVTFDPNGGAVSQASKSVTYGQTYGALPTPTRAGYKFEGWTSGPTGGQVYYTHTRVTETKDHTLYAYWTVKTPTVTLNANGGSVSQTSKRAVYGDPYGALPTPTRTGYTFDGWYTAQTGGSKVDSATKVANGDDHTLYARWSVKTVAVTLNANNGTVTGSPKNVTYGQTYGDLPTPTRAGYAFTGWYTASSGGSKVESSTKVTNANAHTLYARWNRNTYTVTFNANGGSAVATRKVNAGDALGTLPTSTKAGYTFGGWFSGDSQVTKDTVPTGNVTYTARWTVNTYTVTLDYGDGRANGSLKVTYGGAYAGLTTPTRVGYTFDGWYTAASGGTQVSSNTTMTTAGNHTLYAHWTAQTYTVTTDYNYNGGGDTYTVTYGGTYGDGGLPARLNRAGYTFDGWYTAPTGGTQVTASTKVTTAGDHTLYAHWTGSTCTATFNTNGGFLDDGDKNKRVTVGQPYGALPVPTWDGHNFTGWYTALEGGAQVTASTIVTETGTHMLYAHWSLEHTHPLGAGDTAVTFLEATERNLTDDLPSQGGSYFLTSDLDITYHITVRNGQTLNLCLNGHKLTCTGTDASAILVQSGGTLNICDCNGSNGSHTVTSAITGTDTTIQGGLITRSQKKTSVGTGVRVEPNATFNLYSGAIAGISTAADDGSHGAVRVEGAFHMYGGEICHNKIGCGGAVNICDNGTASHFYLHGGSIHHNYASLDDGGAICVNQNAACTISGGSITDNVAQSGGGGIHSYGGSIELSGSPVIQNNRTHTGGTNYSIRLDGGAKLTVSEGFSPAAPIGVSSTTTPTADAPVAVGADGSGAYARYFVADTAGQEVMDNSGVLALKLHSHPLCGASCDHNTDIHDTGNKNYTALTLDTLTGSGDTKTLPVGNYYLAGDLTINDNVKIESFSQVKICLNGHTLKISKSKSLTVPAGSWLFICDCAGGGTFDLGSSAWLYNSGQVNLFGGAMTSDSHVIVNKDNGMVNVYGGTITSTASGAACIVSNQTTGSADNGSGKVNIYGGTLTSGNFGVYSAGSNTTVNVYGGTITGARSGITNKGTVNVSGGTITGENYGIDNDGTATITGGTVTGKSFGIRNSKGSLTVTGGAITSNTHGIYVSENATATLSGTPIIQGATNDIRVDNSTFTVGSSLEGQFRVAYNRSITETTPRTITTAADANQSAHFVPAKDGEGLRDVVGSDGKHTLQLYKLHMHDGVEYENYTVLTDDPEIENGGHYLLTVPVTLNSDTLTIPAGYTVDLCLNGNALTGQLKVEGTLNLYDCKGAGKVTNADRSAVSVASTGVLNYYGGALEGGKSTSVPLYASGVVNLYATPTIITDCAYEIRGNAPGFLHIAAPLTKPETPLRVNFGEADAVNITNHKQVTVTSGWTEHMGEATAADYFIPGAGRRAKVEQSGDELVLRLLRVDMDGVTHYPSYTTGKLTATDLAAPETREGYLWDGWYTAKEEGDKVTADTVFTDDATLYPRWTQCDHSGSTAEKTEVKATCVTAGSITYTCSVCGLEVVEETDALGHDFETDTAWYKDADKGTHYHKCSRCDQRQDEAAHTWNDGEVTTQPTAEAEGVMTFTCTVCKDTTTQTIDKLVAHAVTYTVDDYTVGDTPTQPGAVAGETLTLPTGLTRTGYTLAGWALLDGDGVPGEAVLTGEFTMPDRDVAFAIRWTQVDPYDLKPGETLVLPDGTVIENKTDGTVTIDQGGDGTVDATITLPDGGSVTVGQGEDGKDQVTVPPGAQVETKPDEEGKNITITIKNDDGKVDTDGGVDAPAGSTVVDKDGNTITITEGDGGHIDPDGVVTFPEGEGGKVTVTTPEGETTEVTVPGGGEGLDVTPGGVPLVQDKEDTVTIPDGKGGSTTVTIPDPGPDNDGKGGNGADLDDQGGLVVPGGSTVTKTDDEGNQTTVEVPTGGGTVSGAGDVTLPNGGDVKVTDKDGNQITITVPAGGTVGTDEDGNVTAPAGSTITNPDGTITQLPNGGTVKPSGEVEVKHNWGKWTLQADGTTLKRTCKTNAEHFQEKALAFTVDEGPFTYNGAAQEPEVELKTQAEGEAETLRPRTDYTVAYENNVNAGTAQLTVTGQGNYAFTLKRSFAIGKAAVDPATLHPGSINIANGLENEYVYTLTFLCPAIDGSWGERSYAIQSVDFTKPGYYADGAARIDKVPGGDYANRLFLPILHNGTDFEGVVGTLTIRFSSDNYKDYTNTLRVVANNKGTVVFSGITTPDKTYDGKPYAPAGTVVTKRKGDGYVVSADVELLYTGRNDTSYSPAEPHTPPTDAGEYALTIRVVDADPYYIGRDTYNFRIDKAPGVGSVTMADYTAGAAPSEPVAVSQTNGTDHVSYLYKGKGAADSSYTAVKPTTAGEYTVKATFAATRNYAQVTATADFTVARANLPDDPTALKPGQSIDLPGGGSVENKGAGQVEITDPNGGKTTVTLPQDSDGTVKVDKDTGTVTVPGGSTLTTPDGEGGKTEITVPGSGDASVKPGGEVTLPVGGKVEITDKNGNQTTVTLPNQGGAVKPTQDGKLELPAGATVTKPDGSTVTVPDGGGIVDPATGDVTPAKPDEPTPPTPSHRPSRRPVRGEEAKPEEPKATVDQFTDVKTGDWFYGSVKTIVERGLMNGTGETTFSPKLDTSRAMIATILWRLAGEPEAKTPLTYPDCVADSWYAKAVAWASEQGVVKGYGNGDFGPNDPITREQLAVMLWRYAQAKGRDVSVGEDTNILSYKDFDQAGEWAISALQWAVGSGVMAGRGNDVLDPAGKATRAEAATMLARYLELK